MRITITYELAMAAGRDAANRQMRREGRTQWNEADFDLACTTTKTLLGNEHVETVTLH